MPTELMDNLHFHLSKWKGEKNRRIKIENRSQRNVVEILKMSGNVEQVFFSKIINNFDEKVESIYNANEPWTYSGGQRGVLLLGKNFLIIKMDILGVGKCDFAFPKADFEIVFHLELFLDIPMG